MKSLIVASTREGAGKTSMLVGLSQVLAKRFGYVKPFGDRPLYRKKRLWDYDASLFFKLLGLDQEPETASLGFDHSKARYTYDRVSIFDALRERVNAAGMDRDAVLVEGGRNLAYGASVSLDPLTMSKELDAPVVITGRGPGVPIAIAVPGGTIDMREANSTLAGAAAGLPDRAGRSPSRWTG